MLLPLGMAEGEVFADVTSEELPSAVFFLPTFKLC